MSNLYIDLTDLVVHSVYYGIGTGVQRVQVNLSYCLIQSVSAKTFSVFEGRWENLNDLIVESKGDADQFLSLIRKKYNRTIIRLAHQKSYPLISLPNRCLRKCLKIFGDWKIRTIINFDHDDTIFTMGAFWQYLPLVDFYKKKAEEGVKLIGILHDLIWVNYPQYVDKALFQKFLDLPFHLITVSKFTMQELERAIREKIVTSNYRSLRSTALAHEYIGAKRNERNLHPPEELKNKRYVLYVSSLEPHKNHTALAEAWKELEREHGEKLPQLIFAGKRARSAAEVLKPGNLSDKITFYECPTNEQLKCLYANCLFTVFPSLIEGWGLPVGEGLWFGKACAASNRASIPEVGGDLCLYFAPNQLSDMKSHINSLLDSKTRTELENKIKNAKLRTWEDVAKDLEGMIISILQEKSLAA